MTAGQKLIEEGLQRGLEQGIEQGERNSLSKLLTLKFGELPIWAVTRIESAKPNELDGWVKRVLFVDTLEEALK